MRSICWNRNCSDRCGLVCLHNCGGDVMNDPYEKRSHVFTPQVIAEMAKKNKLAREEKYPILKDCTPPPAEVVGNNVRRLK